MLSVKGTYQNGTIQLLEPVGKRNGQTVIVIFLDEEQQNQLEDDAFWEEFDLILEECQVETGIPDLSYQHDYYIHGLPKRAVES